VALKKRKGETAEYTSARPDLAQQLERATKLIALLLVKGESQPEKMRVLSAAGFANNEIAALLGVTSNTVNVALYKLRAKK